ncbi:calcium homeostasis modulator protein 3-like [Heterodontus francisci]|uniref:calcium homeostasis modulator protein 3-like n=1 Tax=Heterodontus francisci TaxID=7792 RepID=UPI00355BDFEE
MDRFITIFRHFQSNSESMMNGICGILALASIRIYSSFHFTCPCLPIYNTVYGIGVMLLPPGILFFCGIIVNKHSVLMLEEWLRPEGRRTKDASLLRYMFFAVVQRAVIAPVVWLVVALLDGKCVVCAFSTSVDPAHFSNTSGVPGEDLLSLLSKVPCMDLTPVHLYHNLPFPTKAVYRYLRSVSQALGWTLLLVLILAAFLARCLKPCSKHVTFLQSRYWSNYIDIEQKIFEETCCEHARGFARHCVFQFFDSMQSEFKTYRPGVAGLMGEEGEQLHGITDKEQLNNLLMKWYNAKPSLNISPVGQQRQLLKVHQGQQYENSEGHISYFITLMQSNHSDNTHPWAHAQLQMALPSVPVRQAPDGTALSTGTAGSRWHCPQYRYGRLQMALPSVPVRQAPDGIALSTGMAGSRWHCPQYRYGRLQMALPSVPVRQAPDGIAFSTGKSDSRWHCPQYRYGRLQMALPSVQVRQAPDGTALSTGTAGSRWHCPQYRYGRLQMALPSVPVRQAPDGTALSTGTAGSRWHCPQYRYGRLQMALPSVQVRQAPDGTALSTGTAGSRWHCLQYR